MNDRRGQLLPSPRFGRDGQDPAEKAGPPQGLDGFVIEASQRGIIAWVECDRLLPQFVLARQSGRTVADLDIGEALCCAEIRCVALTCGYKAGVRGYPPHLLVKSPLLCHFYRAG